MQDLGIKIGKLYKKYLVITFDILSIPIAWYLAYCLRFNLKPWPAPLFTAESKWTLFSLICVQTACYYYFKVYRGLWGFSSVNDLVKIIKAIAVSLILTLPVLYFLSILQHIPRSVLFLYGMLLILLLSGGRILMRAYREALRQSSTNLKKRVLIIGAGKSGDSLIRDLKRSQEYLPIGFIDDNHRKRGYEIHGIRVIGATSELPELVARYNVDLIFIAIPSAGSATMRRIVASCEKSKVPFRTLPSLNALASGFVQVNSLRAVNIEDLLGRDQVSLDWEKISSSIENKRVVVTGGGGSIGSELCRQIMKHNPKHLLILDNSEFNLYSIGQELDQIFPEISKSLALVSVGDKTAIDFYFHKFQPQIIFHAAAYKHVPMLEDQIRVAVKNNVLGTRIVAEAAVRVLAETFVLISTDKAVNPTNIMGTTKRIAEIYCQNLNQRVKTAFITVRFGNVLGSAGSVVPLFQKQLQAGGPLCVTHPDMERYFMTIPEATQLILQAMVNGQGSEIFVLDMGEPVKISYLAEQMIRLAGKVPGKDIAIQYIGLRPGEKLYEELFHESEELTPTQHEKLFKAKFRQLDWQELTEVFSLLERACEQHDNDELFILLKNLVPEFKGDNRSAYTKVPDLVLE